MLLKIALKIQKIMNSKLAQSISDFRLGFFKRQTAGLNSGMTLGHQV